MLTIAVDGEPDRLAGGANVVVAGLMSATMWLVSTVYMGAKCMQVEANEGMQSPIAAVCDHVSV